MIFKYYNSTVTLFTFSKVLLSLQIAWSTTVTLFKGLNQPRYNDSMYGKLGESLYSCMSFNNFGYSPVTSEMYEHYSTSLKPEDAGMGC